MNDIPSALERAIQQDVVQNGAVATLEHLADAWNGIVYALHGRGEVPSHIYAALELVGRDLDTETGRPVQLVRLS